MQEVQTIKTEEVKPYSKNAKKHPTKQIKQIAESIKVFGFNQPLVLDSSKVIIVGHGRYEAAKYLELSEVPCVVVDLSEGDAKAYRLADNKLNESDWDMELVIEELRGLDTSKVDITGFDSDLLIQIKEDE
ncbi:MAG: ParB/Srx family N-terminal domain-containing protein, partial [Candidatus Falkowbacteria bacterium]|nr:ParB/Srx family N-terminal domain-containing protein [Candidatus Falkowbacteria bacterium]